MKKTLTFSQRFLVGLTLFGMFFGAGNLIFPVHLGQLAGQNVWAAALGFIVTGVTVPVLAVAGIGLTHSRGLQDLCEKKVGRGFAPVFTCLLYLTIGPFFAIPRCCTTTFSTGISPLLPGAGRWASVLFSLLFFAAVLFLSLRPGEIMRWVGKIIAPAFLLFFCLLLAAALMNPGAPASAVAPDPAYESGALFSGMLEGYNTMDAIAGLAFGIIVVGCIRSFGIEDDGTVAAEILKSGIVTAVLMGAIYLASTLMGAQSRGLFEISENGGIALAQIAGHYLGKAGMAVLAITITLACLKTAIGLVTACAETFVKMFPRSMGYTGWAVLFTAFSFGVSNVGLTALINYSLPVLMLIYPPTIVLILLSLLGEKAGLGKSAFRWALAGAVFAAFFDFLRTLPFGLDVSWAAGFLPFYSIGMSWVVPSLLGLLIGLVAEKRKQG